MAVLHGPINMKHHVLPGAAEKGCRLRYKLFQDRLLCAHLLQKELRFLSKAFFGVRIGSLETKAPNRYGK